MIGRLGSPLSGHLGEQSSALIDDQLAPVDRQRAVAHLLICARCRAEVEREGALKRRLSGNWHGFDASAWAAVDTLEDAERRRRLRAVGVGSVGAAVFGVVAFAGPPMVAGASGRPVPREGSITTEVAHAVTNSMGIAARLWKRAAQ